MVAEHLALRSESASFQGLSGPEGEDGIPGTPGRVGPPGKTVGVLIHTLVLHSQ